MAVLVLFSLGIAQSTEYLCRFFFAPQGKEPNTRCRYPELTKGSRSYHAAGVVMTDNSEATDTVLKGFANTLTACICS
jgi:hypothetical protein